jgi:flagellar FliL protein
LPLLSRGAAAGAKIEGCNLLLTIFAYCFRQRRSPGAPQLWMKSLPMTDHAIADDLAETPEGEGKAAAPRLGRKKLILFIAAPLLALLLIGAGLYFTGMLNRFVGSESEGEAHQEKPAEPKKTVFYDLPELLVNLNGAGRKASFLKMSISLELESQVDVARLQAVMPRVIDNFQVYLRELRIEDLRGSGGMYRLREELLLRVNASAAPAKIVDVLFKEMLVQ